MTIAIQEADSSPQEGKSPDAVRALIRRWRLIAFGNRGPAFRYSDFDIRLPRLAREKYVTLRQESRMCGGKSKRGVRQLPDAALIEVASLIPYGKNLTLTSFEQFIVCASHTWYV